MKYDQKYQDAKEGFIAPIEGHVLGPIKLKDGGSCLICGSQTKWGSIQARKYLCSEECGASMWRDLFQVFAISQIFS